MLGSSTVLDSKTESTELGVVPRLCQALFERVKQLQALALSQANPNKPPKPPSQPASSEDKENADVLLPTPAPGPVYQDGALISAGVAVSFYEIYNEQVRDLFSATPSSNKTPQHNLRVREDPKTGVFVENLTSHPVKNYRQVMNLLEIGSEARTTASTNMNATSSRSHAVFTLTLRSEIEDTATPGQTHERTSKISLVDLAGSERANSTGATHDRLREA